MSDAPSTPATPAVHGDLQPGPVDAPAVDALYSPKQIAVATLVATPLAGAVLFAANARAVGSTHVARALVVAAGAAMTAVILGVDVWGAGPFTLLALPVCAFVALLLSAHAFSSWTTSAAARTHGAVGAVVVACWLGLLAASGVVMGAFHLYTPNATEALGDNVEHSPGERVFYRGNARREHATDVARALANAGVFTGNGTLRFVVDDVDAAGELRITLRIPDDAAGAELEAGRGLFKKIAQHMQPPRCVRGRLLTTSGVERANGRLCP
jgi:hypothetical protein